jgi:uncharacterized protein YukE
MGKEPYPDLKFDSQAAVDAVTQLQAVVKLLHTQTSNRATKAKQMGPPNWTGTYSDQFYQNELPRMKTQAGTLISKLNALITTINNAENNYEYYKGQNDIANGKTILAPGLPGDSGSTPTQTTTA